MTSRRLFLSVSSAVTASILLGGERGLFSAAQRRCAFNDEAADTFER